MPSLLRSTRIWTRAATLIVICALLLAACGGDDDDTDENEATATSGASPVATATAGSSVGSPTRAQAEDEEVTLRLGVSMTPAELETFEQGLDAIRAEHPNWTIELEQTPQEGIIEKMNAQVAGKNLPDVVQVQGLQAQQWVRQNAFEDLSARVNSTEFQVDDFWSSTLTQFEWQDKLYGVPYSAAPEVVYYNKAMFDAAGLDYPSDDWTYDEMRDLAIKLTLDTDGNTPADPDFDPDNIVQWGLNITPSNIWARSYLLPLGADPCANEDCTELQYEDPAVQGAMGWWAQLAQVDHAAPYDPYSGNQTGVPGDPFAAGKAAMGFNGFFLVGQLNQTGQLEYDIVQPPQGPTGTRSTALSTNGWSIAANSEHKDAAWQLLQELTDTNFLAEYWAKPGHSVPARKSAVQSILNPSAAPTNQQAIIDAMEYAEVFKPATPSAFEAYGKTFELFTAIMKGDTPLEAGLAEIDKVANEVLAKDE